MTADTTQLTASLGASAPDPQGSMTRSQRQSRRHDFRTNRRIMHIAIIAAIVCALVISFMAGQESGWDMAHHRACTVAPVTCTKISLEP